MSKGRLEAFSDGVLAIVITIMVLELKVPEGVEFTTLRPLVPVLLSYVLSFIYLAIYWNNHHNLLHATRRVNGSILWANLHLLFWLSLFPFATGWLGENHVAPLPAALYGCVLFMAAVAYYLLERVILASHRGDPALSAALACDWKEKLSVVLYLTAIPASFIKPWIANGIYVFVAILWFVPDRRLERVVAETR